MGMVTSAFALSPPDDSGIRYPIGHSRKVPPIYHYKLRIETPTVQEIIICVPRDTYAHVLLKLVPSPKRRKSSHEKRKNNELANFPPLEAHTYTFDYMIS